MRTPAELKSLFEEHLATITEQAHWSGHLYQPMRYILGLGGKRIRPVLLLLAYQSLSGKDATKALNAAAAVELFHNFSLLHDDIMDNAPVRRGQPTVHEKWDENTAILSGDAMFALTFELLIRDFPGRAAALVPAYTDVSIGVCEGQMDDMVMAAEDTADIPRYLEMIRNKTAVLIGGAMSMAAICADAPAALVDQIRTYGEVIGTAFQLQDDYLDAYAEQAKFGKQVGGDILENKKTYLLLRTYEKANPEQRQELDRLLNEENPAAKIKGVMVLYQDLGIKEETKALILDYFDRAEKLATAMEHFDGFSHIQDFMGNLMQRDF